jgi:choline-sulfatase
MTLTGPGIPGAVNNTPVSLTDLASTIEHAVGAEVESVSAPWRGRPLQGFALAPEPERAVISEYHDGGSPCGFYMLRQQRWKLVCFAEGNPPLLFDIEQDPHELHNLADDAAHATILQQMLCQLSAILDPEAVNAQAFADQASMIEAYGGLESIRAMPSFNHTPLEPA